MNAFAFKIFCSTQYLRNVKNPDYTPEPDIVHEIAGHIPIFADPHVAVIFDLLRNYLIESVCFHLEHQIKILLNWEVFTGSHFNLEFVSRLTELKAMVLVLQALSDRLM